MMIAISTIAARKRGHGVSQSPKVLLAMAAGVALIAASPAAAGTEIFLQSGAMVDPGTASINGALININAYSAPITFTANLGSAFDAATTYSFLGWCVDIFHEINLGPMNLQYTGGALVTDQGGGPLTGLQLDKISSLVNYGTYLYGHGGDSDQMAGIQGAIWTVENPTYTITGGNAAIQTLIGQYAAEAANVLPVGAMHTIFEVDGATQAFGVAGGVPEPASWALLIVGFGSVGAAIRRRRRQTLSAPI